MAERLPVSFAIKKACGAKTSKLVPLRLSLFKQAELNDESGDEASKDEKGTNKNQKLNMSSHRTSSKRTSQSSRFGPEPEQPAKKICVGVLEKGQNALPTASAVANPSYQRTVRSASPIGRFHHPPADRRPKSSSPAKSSRRDESADGPKTSQNIEASVASGELVIDSLHLSFELNDLQRKIGEHRFKVETRKIQSERDSILLHIADEKLVSSTFDVKFPASQPTHQHPASQPIFDCESSKSHGKDNKLESVESKAGVLNMLPTQLRGKRLVMPSNILPLGFQLPDDEDQHFTDCQPNRSVVISEMYSPSRFYIQFKKGMEKLETMENEIDSCYAEDKIDNLRLYKEDMQDGLYVCTQFFGKWHRARIIGKISETHAKILFVDYGTITRRCFTELFFLLDKPMFQMAAMAFKASLYNIKPLGAQEWTEAANKRFAGLVYLGPDSKDSLVAKFHSGGTPCDPVYKLWLTTFPKQGEIVKISKRLIDERLAIEIEPDDIIILDEIPGEKPAVTAATIPQQRVAPLQAIVTPTMSKSYSANLVGQKDTDNGSANKVCVDCPGAADKFVKSVPSPSKPPSTQSGPSISMTADTQPGQSFVNPMGPSMFWSMPGMVPSMMAHPAFAPPGGLVAQPFFVPSTQQQVFPNQMPQVYFPQMMIPTQQYLPTQVFSNQS